MWQTDRYRQQNRMKSSKDLRSAQVIFLIHMQSNSREEEIFSAKGAGIKLPKQKAMGFILYKANCKWIGSICLNIKPLNFQKEVFQNWMLSKEFRYSTTETRPIRGKVVMKLERARPRSRKLRWEDSVSKEGGRGRSGTGIGCVERREDKEF